MLTNKGRHNTTKLGPNAVQELKINQRRILIDSLEIGIPAPKQMIALGERQLPNGVKVGQLLNSKTLNYKKFTPHRDGLFCERIFGPVQSFVCACGKKKESVQGKNRQKEIVNKEVLTSTSTMGGGEGTDQLQKQALFCPKCQVEYVSKDVRRHRLGYIKLFAPVTHIWYLKGRPSYLSLFLGKRKKAMTSLAYCNAFLVEQVYSDLKLETQNVLKNVEKSTTDLLEKNNIKKGKKDHVNNLNKKQALYKFGKSDVLDACTSKPAEPLTMQNKQSKDKENQAFFAKALVAPDWFQTHKTLTNQIIFFKRNCEENYFFSLLVKLFPETCIQSYLFTNSSLHSIKGQSFDKEKQKTKQRNKTRVAKRSGSVQKRTGGCKTSFCTPGGAFASLCTSFACARPRFLTDANITKHNRQKSDLFQNNAAFSGTSYIRAQTLPFLPSLISPFHLRDCLISFLQSSPCREDVPIPLYCQTPRRYPLRDVHKFITEFRSREATKKTERLTSDSITRLTSLSKHGKPSIRSYSNFFYKRKAREKEIKNACTKAELWFANVLDAQALAPPFVKSPAAYKNEACKSYAFARPCKNGVFAKAGLFLRPGRMQNKQPGLLNKAEPCKNRPGVAKRAGAVQKRSFCNGGAFARAKAFAFAKAGLFVKAGLLHTQAKLVQSVKTKLAKATLLHGRAKTEFLQRQSFLHVPFCSHRVLNNNLKLRLVLPLRLITTFTRFKVITFALPRSNSLFDKSSTIREKNKSILSSATNKEKAKFTFFNSSVKAEREAVNVLSFLSKYQYKGKSDYTNKLGLQKPRLCKSKSFCTYKSRAKATLLQTSFCNPHFVLHAQAVACAKQNGPGSLLHHFTFFEQNKALSNFLFDVQLKNSKKTWNGCFGEYRVDNQSNPQGLYTNLFNNNLLSFSIKKETQTYQARLLYMVFGSVNQNSNLNHLTQPGFDSSHKCSKKQPFLNNRDTSLYPTVLLLKESVDITNQKKKLDKTEAKAFATPVLFGTTQQQRVVTFSSPSFSGFIQAIKSGNILTVSFSINLPFFISGSKQNRVFFITKKERKTEWKMEKTDLKLVESFFAQAQTKPNFFLFVNEQPKVLSKAELCFIHQYSNSLWKKVTGDAFLQLPFGKKSVFFSSNVPESISKETDKRFLTFFSNKARSSKKHSDFISNSFPDLNVFSCILVKKFTTSEQRTLTHHSLTKSIKVYNTCVNQAQKKQSDNINQQKGPALIKTKISPLAQSVRAARPALARTASVTGMRNFSKSSFDLPFTKMWLEQKHASLLATHSYLMFLKESVLNKASLYSSAKTLKVKSDQVKTFTDTDKALFKDSQTSFGSEMISKWHLNGAREILLYTGGGALESLLKRFNISLFYEFLFCEIQILRKYYKNQLFILADYNTNKTLEKQDYAKQAAAYKKPCKSFAFASQLQKPGRAKPGPCKNSVFATPVTKLALQNEPAPVVPSVKSRAKATLLQAFAKSPAAYKNDVFVSGGAFNNPIKDLNLSKQHISLRFGPENKSTSFKGGETNIQQLHTTKVMQVVNQSSVFNVYKRRSHFVKAAIKAEIPKSFDIGEIKKQIGLPGENSFTKPGLRHEAGRAKAFAPPVVLPGDAQASLVQSLKPGPCKNGVFARPKAVQKRRFCKPGVQNEVLQPPVVHIPVLQNAQSTTFANGDAKDLLITEKNTNSYCRRIYRTTRRLKIVQLLMRSQRRPEWMLISILPVLPPDLRPVLQMGENLIVASDLNTLYQRVIYRNNRHYKGRFLDFHFVSSIHRLVQDAVDRLIENGKGGSTPFLTPGGRPLKSLSDILKGKRGRFRFNLLGKRVDFSGRSVIVVSPNLKIHECGLPREMALELYKYLLIRQLLLKKRVSSIVNAKKVIKQRKPFIWDMLREIIYYHPLLLNRAPTLHRLGIQAFQPKLTIGNAILLHPLVCAGFNADFDGDQMGVHLPLSPQARAEAWDLLWSRNNLLSPATGQPILLPSQDMVLGFYYMTALLPSGSKFTHRDEEQQLSSERIITNRGRAKTQFLQRLAKTTLLHGQSFKKISRFLNKDNSTASNKNKISTYVFSDTTQIVHAYQKKQIDIHTPIWLKWAGKSENGEKHQTPLELRLDVFGYRTQIYPTYKYKSHIYKDKNTSFFTFKKNNTVTIHIRTTVGRVLVNNLINRH